MRVVPLFAVLVPLLALAGPPSDTASREPGARITLKTHGTLRDVAERIASEGKLSVVVRGDLDEDAEVYFQNVPADEALETLARAYGLSLEKRGNIYTLRPHAEGSPPPKMVARSLPSPPAHAADAARRRGWATTPGHPSSRTSRTRPTRTPTRIRTRTRPRTPPRPRTSRTSSATSRTSKTSRI